MAWSISTRNMQNLHSFAAAESFWNATPLWKNKNVSWRPLDSTRMEHKRLVRNRDGGYECVLYSTALVTYYPDSVYLCAHGSTSSSMFIWRVCPKGCQLTSQNGERFWQVDTPEGKRFYRGDIELSAQGKNLWKLKSKAETVQERVYDRKVGAEARKLLKPYKDWYTMTTRLGVKLPHGKYLSHYTTAQGIRTLSEAPDNVTQFLTIADMIGSPESATKAAYEEFGAYSYQDVPHDRLPRRTNS